METKEKILKAGAEIIAHEGLRSFTAKNLAKRVGISDAAVFKHFSSMEEVAQELFDRFTSDCLRRVERVVRSKKDPKEKLEKLIETQIRMLERTKGILPLICLELVRSNRKPLKEKASAVLNAYASLVKEVIKEGVEKGVFKEELDLDEVAYSLIGLMQAKAFQWFVRGKKGRIVRDPETLKKLVLTGMLR
ncbi:MAG: TetR/AcrR family transcriptional regulator [Aquificae bacterium]|nr:TetR/AcrR family transcriptional regulator [Aquificota bacterium]